MSAFKICKTKITDAQMLIDCICAVEPSWKNKIVKGKDLAVYGYLGDDRTKLDKSNKNYCPSAEIVVPGAKSKHGANTVGGASNDLAFVRQEDGTLSYVCSDYDSTLHGNQTSWWKEISSLYNGEKLPETVADLAKTMVQQASTSGKQVVSQGAMMDINTSGMSQEVQNHLGKDVKAIPMVVQVPVQMTKAQYNTLMTKHPELAQKLKKKLAYA